MLNINRFFQNTEKPFHSSGYAKVAHGDAIGSTSAESFRQRLHINRNRRAIGKYNDSYIANNTLDNPRSSGVSVPPRPASSPAPRGFVEPPVRRYNPYK